MLKIEQLDVKERSGRYLLKDISMEIPAGRVIGLTGKSGSGKTTLLRSILGMLHTSCHIDAGKILLDDIDLSHLSRKSHRELCGKKLGFIPQNPMTAFDSRLKIGYQMRETFVNRLHLNTSEATDLAKEKLVSVNLKDTDRILGAYPSELYVPVFSGVFSPIVYSIPFYKLLDTEESNIAKTMYPCEIEPILSEKINATEILQLWVDAMKKIGEIKLYLKRYQQIIQVPVDEKCLCSMTSYIKLLMEQINVLWEEFLLLEDTVSVMIEDADEQSSKQLNFVQHFFDCYEKIEAVISSKNDSTELIQVIEMVYIVMFALLPFVSKYDLQHKNI